MKLNTPIEINYLSLNSVNSDKMQKLNNFLYGRTRLISNKVRQNTLYVFSRVFYF